MNIAQMEMQMMFQAHANALNAISEAGILASAGPNADVWGGGGMGLIVNGSVNQYPVPHVFMAGQFAAGASLTRRSRER